MTQEITKYAFIDALRGYGILGVVMVHSSQFVAPANQTLREIMSNGARGVQLFYIASAMTLCMSLASRISHEHSWRRNFFIRRFFRIAPMFYIAVFGYSYLYGSAPRYWAPNGIEWWYVPLTIVFQNGFLPETINSVVPGGWSIAVEFNFYLLLPFLFAVLKTRTAFVSFLVFSVAVHAASQVVFSHLFSPHYPADQQYIVSEFCRLNILSQLPVFSLGLIAYFELKNSQNLKTVIGIGWLLFLASLLGLVLDGGNIIGTEFYHSWSDVYFAFGLWLFAVSVACYPVAPAVNFAIVQVGKLSFSMYLIHFAVLDALFHFGWQNPFASGNFTSMLYFLLVLLITVCASYFTYTIIERPGIRLGNRLIDGLERMSA